MHLLQLQNIVGPCPVGHSRVTLSSLVFFFLQSKSCKFMSGHTMREPISVAFVFMILVLKLQFYMIFNICKKGTKKMKCFRPCLMLRVVKKGAREIT